jgi:hypothetical protein
MRMTVFARTARTVTFRGQVLAASGAFVTAGLLVLPGRRRDA